MNPWIHVTGWTLIHFVWQGGLLAVATAAGLRLCSRRSSNARYAIACIGLAAMLAAPAATAAFLLASRSVLLPAGNILSVIPVSEPTLTRLRIVSDDVSSFTSGGAGTTIRLDAWLPVVVWGWLAGVIFLLARFSGGCWRVHRLKVVSLTQAVSPWQSASDRLAARLRLDVAFRVVESTLVHAPIVIGWIRPVILLPASVLTNLTAGQIEALLAHELAHIRRRDYAVNLFQTVAETLLFFHPGVWWVSTRIRQEREHCCDDVAVELCGEPTAYAEALAELASWRTREAALSVGAAAGSLRTRIHRLLRVPEDAEPRALSGLVVLAVSMVLAAGIVLLSSSSIVANASTPGSLANAQAGAAAVQPPAEDRQIRKTDHFEIRYQPDLDLHAERLGREAERAYERISGDLKHNLAFKIPVILFHTTSALEQSVQAGGVGQRHVASFDDPSRDRILFAVDHPPDQWFGLITHEVAHVFGFDIVPGAATPRWIAEGLAEYERGAWDPSDLVALRDAVRANAIPKLSGLHGDQTGRASQLVYGLGHAAFDFIESRWGKPGVRQFLFSLRQTARSGGDPYQGAFQISRDEFDQAFERYLRERLSGAADESLAGRFDYRASLRIEGDITAIKFPVSVGLACIELWVMSEGENRQRWGVECGDETGPDLIRALMPGDRVIVTGAPARKPATQRMVMRTLVRPSDGLTWHARSG